MFIMVVGKRLTEDMTENLHDKMTPSQNISIEYFEHISRYIPQNPSEKYIILTDLNLCYLLQTRKTLLRENANTLYRASKELIYRWQRHWC